MKYFFFLFLFSLITPKILERNMEYKNMKRPFIFQNLKT